MLVVIENPSHHGGLILVLPFDGLIEDVGHIVHGKLAQLEVLPPLRHHVLDLDHDRNGNPLADVLIDQRVPAPTKLEPLILFFELTDYDIVDIRYPDIVLGLGFSLWIEQQL